MFSCVHRLRQAKKGQIFPILVVIAVILIIAALITANLGKVSIDRLSTITAADAGVLAGISDFTAGYNKVSWLSPPMAFVAGMAFGFLIVPQCWWCLAYRQVVATIAISFNDQLYDWGAVVVKGYSESARKDAYYYAFINAGVDDKYKWDGGMYRDKPTASESWAQWTGYESAFSKWINDTFDYAGWQNAGSYTYTWQNGSKWVTVYVNASSPENLDYFSLPLIGIYLWPITKVCTCCLPLPFWHGNIKAWLEGPSTRWVRVRVDRSYQQPNKSLGFWTVQHPTTSATAETEMTGGPMGAFSWPEPFDFTLTQ